MKNVMRLAVNKVLYISLVLRKIGLSIWKRIINMDSLKMKKTQNGAVGVAEFENKRRRREIFFR